VQNQTQHSLSITQNHR